MLTALATGIRDLLKGVDCGRGIIARQVLGVKRMIRSLRA